MDLPPCGPGVHLDILADKAIICRKIRELYRALTTFDAGKSRAQDREACSEKYSPEAVLPIFEKVFLRQGLPDRADR